MARNIEASKFIDALSRLVHQSKSDGQTSVTIEHEIVLPFVKWEDSIRRFQELIGALGSPKYIQFSEGIPRDGRILLRATHVGQTVTLQINQHGQIDEKAAFGQVSAGAFDQSFARALITSLDGHDELGHSSTGELASSLEGASAYLSCYLNNNKRECEKELMVYHYAAARDVRQQMARFVALAKEANSAAPDIATVETILKRHEMEATSTEERNSAQVFKVAIAQWNEFTSNDATRRIITEKGSAAVIESKREVCAQYVCHDLLGLNVDLGMLGGHNHQKIINGTQPIKTVKYQFAGLNLLETERGECEIPCRYYE